MGYLDRCPTVHGCCGCVGLRAGVLLSALAGLAAGALYLAAYTAGGARLLASGGAPPAVKRAAVRYAHGVLGVLLLASHALLLSAGSCRNRTLCELYAWSALVLCLGVLAINLFVVVSSFDADPVAYGLVLLLAALCVTLCELYSIVVVINFSRTLPGIAL